MANYAKVTLIGRIGQEPQQKQAGQSTVVETSLAVNQNRKGDNADQTNWYRLTFWNKTGETVMQYVKKGDQLFVEGKLFVRDYTKADGTQGYSLEVTVSDFQLLGSKDGATQSEPRAERSAPEPTRARSTNPVAAQADDDLPF